MSIDSNVAIGIELLIFEITIKEIEGFSYYFEVCKKEVIDLEYRKIHVNIHYDHVS